MKSKTVLLILSLVLSVFMFFSGIQAQESTASDRIEVIAIQDSTATTGLPVIPWVKPDDDSWKQGKPVFTATDNVDLSMQGWVAVSDEYILMHIIVQDPVHINTSVVRSDDGNFAVALTDRGPELWAHFLGKYSVGYLSDGKRDYPCRITRDEDKKTTTYELSFPWHEFMACAGLSPIIGLTVQVNNTGGGRQNRIYWGPGAGGMAKPGLFVKMALSNPPQEFFGSQAKNSCHGKLSS